MKAAATSNLNLFPLTITHPHGKAIRPSLIDANVLCVASLPKRLSQSQAQLIVLAFLLWLRSICLRDNSGRFRTSCRTCHYYATDSNHNSLLTLRGGGDSDNSKALASAVNQDPTKKKSRPLWSGGVYQEDIDRLVDACLQDPDINIASVPDWLEKQVYRSTIVFILNALHRGLNGIHGKLLWNHEFQLTRLPRRKDRLEEALSNMSRDTTSREHVQALEQVADRLLANKNINQPLIPDVLERQIYTNCLKIVFRVLDLLAVSFRLRLCGHDLQLKLEPSGIMTRESYEQAALERLASSSSSSSSSSPSNESSLSSSCLDDLSMKQMMQMAREWGAMTLDQRPFWQRWLSPANNDFIAQIHASVYCLILGIVDDLLENTEIQLLSDRIEFDLVPAIESENDNKENGGPLAIRTSKQKKLKRNDKSNMKTKQTSLLLVGVALGYALHAIVENRNITGIVTAFGADACQWVQTTVPVATARTTKFIKGLPLYASKAAKALMARIQLTLGKKDKSKTSEAATDDNPGPGWFGTRKENMIKKKPESEATNEPDGDDEKSQKTKGK